MRERKLWFDLNDDSIADPDVAILGLPFDGNAIRRAGAAAAPERLRSISRTSDAITRRGRPIDGVTVHDYGDVAAAAASGRAASQPYLLEAAARLADLPPDSFVLALGGDNSVGVPCLQRFARLHGPRAGIVWFDAHPDLLASYDGDVDSHACALRRALTLSGLPTSRVVLLGTRSFSREEAQLIRDERIEVIPAAEWWSLGADDVTRRIVDRLEGSPAVYLAIDIDGFDSSCAPGTGYPMPGGPHSEMFFAVQERLFERLPVRAMHITEIAPPLDTNDATSFLGAQIVLETLGALAAPRVMNSR